jgi:hypothetical protein
MKFFHATCAAPSYSPFAALRHLAAKLCIATPPLVTTPASVPGLLPKYQGDVVHHKQVVANGTRDLLVAFSRVSREAREAVYKAIAQLEATTMHTKR